MAAFIDQLSAQVGRTVRPVDAATALYLVRLSNPHNPNVTTTPFNQLGAGEKAHIQSQAQVMAGSDDQPAAHQVQSVRTAERLNLLPPPQMGG